MKINVGVFFGGRSVEHEISVISAVQAIHAIDKSKYSVQPIYITKKGVWYTGDSLLDLELYKNEENLLSQCKKILVSPEFNNFNIQYKEKGLLSTKIKQIQIDLAFPILHGTFGEDGCIQGLFELKGLPYVGCNVLSSAVGMDKIAMKMVLKEEGVPVTDYCWFYSKDWYKNKEQISVKIEYLGFPVIVKPANLGSSVGISTAKNIDELEEAIDAAASYTKRILVESLVTNLREINCSVLGDYEQAQASVCEEPVSSGEILSYKDKYMSGSGKNSKGMSGTQRKIPADLSDDMASDIQDLALKTFKALDCAGVSRIDFLIDETTQKVYVNEINTIPGSLSFYLWEPTGIPYDKLIDKMLELALKHHREKENLVSSYDQNIFAMGGNPLNMGKGSKGKL